MKRRTLTALILMLVGGLVTAAVLQDVPQRAGHPHGVDRREEAIVPTGCPVLIPPREVQFIHCHRNTQTARSQVPLRFRDFATVVGRLGHCRGRRE